MHKPYALLQFSKKFLHENCFNLFETIAFEQNNFFLFWKSFVKPRLYKGMGCQRKPRDAYVR